MTTKETPTVELDPDGRPLFVVDLAGDPRDLILWGMVEAGRGVALVCTDHDDPPSAGALLLLSDALVDDPNDPNLTPGSRAWEKARADAAVAELARQAERVTELEQERDEARAHASRAWQQLNEESARADEAADFAHTLRGRAEAAERALTGAREQIEALTAEVDAARTAGRDVARLAVIALTHVGKTRRRLARLAHRTRRTP